MWSGLLWRALCARSTVSDHNMTTPATAPIRANVAGLSFYADKVDCSSESPLLARCRIYVPPGSDADVKLGAMYNADMFVHNPGRVALMITAEHMGYSAASCWWSFRAPGCVELTCLAQYSLLVVPGTDPRSCPPVAAAPRCECGSGDHTRGPGHASYCHLLVAS